MNPRDERLLARSFIQSFIHSQQSIPDPVRGAADPGARAEDPYLASADRRGLSGLHGARFGAAGSGESAEPSAEQRTRIGHDARSPGEPINCSSR